MSSIFRKPLNYHEGFDQFSQHFVDSICDICGEHGADAHWCCASSINICYWCAITTLPALIADAMRARHDGRSREMLNDTFKAIETNFYRAAAIAYSEDPEPHEIADERDRKLRDEWLETEYQRNQQQNGQPH